MSGSTIQSITPSRQEFQELIKNKSRPILFKFTATWCGPCKKVAPVIHSHIDKGITQHIDYYEIDVDESMDVYGFMSSKRMVRGVPALLYYDMSCTSFAPLYNVCTGKTEVVDELFNTIWESFDN